MSKRYGLLTLKQLHVLKYRSKGLSTREIASILQTSHQDVAYTLKCALRNIERARKTLMAYRVVTSPVRIILQPGTRLVDIPSIVLSEADKVGLKVQGDFTVIFKLVRFRARECISEKRVVKPIMVLIDSMGEVDVTPLSEVVELLELLGEKQVV